MYLCLLTTCTENRFEGLWPRLTVHVQEVEKQAAVAAAKTEGQTAADEQARPFITCDSHSPCQAKAVLCNPAQDLCVIACQQLHAERFARCQATVW